MVVMLRVIASMPCNEFASIVHPERDSGGSHHASIHQSFTAHRMRSCMASPITMHVIIHRRAFNHHRSIECHARKRENIRNVDERVRENVCDNVCACSRVLIFSVRQPTCWFASPRHQEGKKGEHTAGVPPRTTRVRTTTTQP
jgi:hypothetical protein